jgi:hypothetical protein
MQHNRHICIICVILFNFKILLAFVISICYPRFGVLFNKNGFFLFSYSAYSKLDDFK